MSRERRPATTLEGRQRQVVSQAINLAEKQIQDGTASSQVITHFLKLGSTREQLEESKIQQELELMKAKTDSLSKSDEMKVLYDNALTAFKSYGGHDTGGDEFD